MKDIGAVRWYRLAAEQGLAIAQGVLGAHVPPPVWASRRTPRKPSGGPAWAPSRETPSRSSTSALKYRHR